MLWGLQNAVHFQGLFRATDGGGGGRGEGGGARTPGFADSGPLRSVDRKMYKYSILFITRSPKQQMIMHTLIQTSVFECNRGLPLKYF